MCMHICIHMCVHACVCECMCVTFSPQVTSFPAGVCDLPTSCPTSQTQEQKLLPGLCSIPHLTLSPPPVLCTLYFCALHSPSLGVGPSQGWQIAA